jgi:hypothetical protein
MICLQLSTTQVVHSGYSVEEWRYGVRCVRALSMLHLPLHWVSGRKIVIARIKTLINSISTLFELHSYESCKGNFSEHHVYYSNIP